MTVSERATVEPFRVREITYAPGHSQPCHAHPGASVALVLAGALRETAGRREETAGALSVVAKLPGTEHADEFGPDGARTLQIAIDPAALAGRYGAGTAIPRWRWIHGGDAARSMVDLWRCVRTEVPPIPDTEVEDAVLDVLAAVVEPSPGPARGSGTPDRALPGWLATARETLDDVLPARISVRRLAELSGVHPVSLSRAFRCHYGCTITEYRRRVRAGRAATLLTDTRREISRIAHEVGFADHAHLCRTFREITGLTPGGFRRLVRRG